MSRILKTLLLFDWIIECDNNQNHGHSLINAYKITVCEKVYDFCNDSLTIFHSYVMISLTLWWNCKKKKCINTWNTRNSSYVETKLTFSFQKI